MKKSIIFFTIFSVCSISFAQRAEKILKKAMVQNLKGYYSNSSKYCEKAISKDPTLVGSYFLLAKNMDALHNKIAAFKAKELGLIITAQNTKVFLEQANNTIFTPMNKKNEFADENKIEKRTKKPKYFDDDDDENCHPLFGNAFVTILN
ncbi:MAG: hypothetical protein HXX09_09240 [Bacteroidetes bacterium]|nr:hypothetical protein [Bacteroidota bacterium]